MRRFGVFCVLIFLGMYALTGLREVRRGEQVVVRRFGRVLDVRPEPGLWVGLPWGMDRVDRILVDEVRRAEIGYQPGSEDSNGVPLGQMVSGDHNLVNVQVVLHYAVRPEAIVDFVVHADRVESLVARSGEAVLAEWVAGRPVDEVLLRGKVDLPSWVIQRTQERLDANDLGVEVREATVAHLLPPAEVKSAFDAVTQAEAENRTRLYNAEQESARRLQEAEAERYRMGRLAESQAHDRLSLAEAEAESFERRLRQYHEARVGNPNALAALWWEEMGRLFARMREGGRIDLLDNRLGASGLDITVVTPLRKK